MVFLMAIIRYEVVCWGFEALPLLRRGIASGASTKASSQLTATTKRCGMQRPESVWLSNVILITVREIEGGVSL